MAYITYCRCCGTSMLNSDLCYDCAYLMAQDLTMAEAREQVQADRDRQMRADFEHAMKGLYKGHNARPLKGRIGGTTNVFAVRLA